MPLSPFLAIAAMLPLSELRASSPIRPDIIGPARAVLAGFLLLALILQTMLSGNCSTDGGTVRPPPAQTLLIARERHMITSTTPDPGNPGKEAWRGLLQIRPQTRS